jgi:hypothetical protein
MKLESTGITHIYSTGVPMAKPDAIQYDKDGNEMAHWRFDLPAPKQEPYGYFRYDIQLDAWVQNKESTQGVAFYTAPVHASDISQERVDETAKRKHEWVGLTEEELKTWKTVPIFEGVDPDQIRWIARKAEETLKEKNT